MVEILSLDQGYIMEMNILQTYTSDCADQNTVVKLSFWVHWWSWGSCLLFNMLVQTYMKKILSVVEEESHL